MAGWQVTEQAIAAMNNMSAQLQELASKIHQESEKIKSIFEDSQDGLGTHSGDISKLIQSVELAEQDGSRPLAKLQLKLNCAALIRQKHLEENRYGNNAGDRTVAATVSSSGSAGMAAGVGVSPSTATFQAATQSEHKSYISSYEGGIAAVQEDVKSGSGQTISAERAAEMLSAVRYYSSDKGFTPIRKAYNNPNADPKDISSLHALDDYIKSAPKWKGQVFRGISVTQAEATEIMSGSSVDMRGPASWSSEPGVAERFSNGYKDVRIVFVLDDNKSGASISHIGTFDGMESEVTSPSGVKYYIDRIRKVPKNGSEIIFIDVHE